MGDCNNVINGRKTMIINIRKLNNGTKPLIIVMLILLLLIIIMMIIIIMNYLLT